jgi:hypothetical protein
MRTARLLGEGRSFYHVISRVVDRRMVFSPKDKEFFRITMRKLEAFTGIRVATYCIMSNHFHLLLDVPDRAQLRPLSEQELLDLLPLLYSHTAVQTIQQELARAREAGDDAWHAQILARFERRRGDMGLFLKDLKQRVTIHMNRRLGRTGTLWEGRYKSLLIEGSEPALMTVAAYIDLNPIRAGIAQNPEDYRWCGYAEAMSGARGARAAREGLATLLAESLHDPSLKADWRRTSHRYRQLLYEDGAGRSPDEARGTPARKGFSQATSEAVVKGRGRTPLPTILRHRVRYFCDGAALGTASFVDAVFAREQSRGQRFGPRRKTGARTMRGADWGELRVLRDLQKDVIGRQPG